MLVCNFSLITLKFSLSVLSAIVITIPFSVDLLGLGWLGFSMPPGSGCLLPSPGWEKVFSYYFKFYCLYSSLYSPSEIPIMQLLLCLMKLLRFLNQFLLLFFSLAWLISIILSSTSLIHYASSSLLLIPSSVFLTSVIEFFMFIFYIFYLFAEHCTEILHTSSQVH